MKETANAFFLAGGLACNYKSRLTESSKPAHCIGEPGEFRGVRRAAGVCDPLCLLVRPPPVRRDGLTERHGSIDGAIGCEWSNFSGMR